MAFEEQLVAFLQKVFPPWFITIFIAMFPFVELRGSLPVAYFVFHYPLWQAFFLSIIGNMIPVPIILYFFRPVEKWLRKRYKWWDSAFDRMFKHTRKRYHRWWKKHGDIAVIVFVGIHCPSPGHGQAASYPTSSAWTSRGPSTSSSSVSGWPGP